MCRKKNRSNFPIRNTLTRVIFRTAINLMINDCNSLDFEILLEFSLNELEFAQIISDPIRNFCTDHIKTISVDCTSRNPPDRRAFSGSLAGSRFEMDSKK